ncbi:hypothetical protein PTKIN_Ptkin15bG0152300 [Pterospermum kingtungense]
MASTVPDEPPCNTQETDEETIAFRKKRSRRVSFADREITSVHIFNRDDDYETPPDSTPRPASEGKNELLDLFSDLVGSDDDGGGDDDDDDVLSARKSFLKPMESPSPGGSSTVGSAASNDEDNFFGPVSANFIRPGRLSDSAASEDNHDITMDSTAFSLHFRSIVRSDSGDLNTSTRVHLASEEKTPCETTMPSDPESFMVLTKVKKLKSPSPSPINKFSGGRDSNDMSLVGESMHRYDYGRLSPTLEVLLAEGSMEINAIPASDSTSPKLSISEVALSHDNESDSMELSHYRNSDICNINNHDMSGEGISFAQDKLVEATGDLTISLTDKIMRDCSSNAKDSPLAENFVDHEIQTHDQLKKGNKEISEVVSGTSMLDSEFLDVATSTPLNQSSEVFQLDFIKQFEHGNQPPTKDGLKENSNQDKRHTSSVGQTSNQQHESPLAGSIHSLSAKRQQILLDTTNSPRRALFVTPSPKHSGSVLSKGSVKQGGSVPSILKSNSKSNIVEPSPHPSSFIDGIVKSNLTLSESLSSRASSLNTIMEKPSKGLQCQRAIVPTINLEEHFSSVDPKQGKMDCNGVGTPKSISTLSQDGGAKVCSPTEHQGSLSGNLKLHDLHSSAIIVSRQEFDSVETALSSNYLTATAENGMQSGSPLVTVNHLIDSSIVKGMDGRENNGLYLQNTSENFRNSPYGFPLKLQSGSPEKNIWTAIEMTGSRENFIEEQMKVSTAYASLDAHRSKTEWSPRKSPFKKKQTRSPNSKEPSRSPCRKEMHKALSVAEDMESLSCNSTIQRIDDCYQRSAPNSSPVQEIQNSSKRKRTSETVALVDVHHADQNNRIQWSSKFHEIGEKNMEHMLESPNGSKIGNERIEGGKTLMNWTDISHKLSADTNQLLSPSSDNLNIKLINMLEDILLHQQKVNVLEMLCSEIQSKLCSAYDQSSNIRYKRVAETRPLLYRLVNEKAKLQLMHVKRERLLKQVQLLRTGVQESQNLKLNCVKHPSVSAKKDAQLASNSCSVRFGDNLEGTRDKVSAMKHEAEALEKKIKNLTKSFYTYCKIKGEPSCFDTIELLNDHLKKRTCCRFIRQDMQLWEIDDLQNRNGHHNVVLNYHEFMSQSFTFNSGPSTSFFVANKLNDINISENFPNMDACSAFSFVFNHKYTKKYVGSKSLAQETQMTSSLLRNLLDVVEEVQIAQLEIRNLTQASFHSPSAEQLDLQLSFIDFDSGVKLMMTLDVTCLNCGVYPSEILPYNLQTPTAVTENLQRSPLLAEIEVAVGNLSAGYSRIIRLCRCVPRVLQSSGR